MEWIMAHPNMTFTLIVFGLMIIDSGIADICSATVKIAEMKYTKKTDHETRED